MASGTRLREAGQRKPPPHKTKSNNVISNSLHSSVGHSAESRLNVAQVHALENMFQSNPAVQAARTVLSGQILSGGISLKKDGKEVALTPAFKSHLAEVWVPFAQEVIDAFLKWGVVPIAYEDYEDEARRAALMSKRRRVQHQSVKSRGNAVREVETSKNEPVMVVPIVPSLGSYEIAYRPAGKNGYRREYLIYACAPTKGVKEDEESRVIVRQHPDAVGNVNSPLASVFELGSFVGALTELAITAEASRARPRMVTQMRKKDKDSMDPSNLFFDTESRAFQANADADENAAQARSLHMQQQMCELINRLQTKHTFPQDSHAGVTSSSRGQYAPPEVSPSLFYLPKVRFVHLLGRSQLLVISRVCTGP